MWTVYENVDDPINIMTSCDENLANQVSVLLQSIADNLSDRKINFFLVQSQISKSKIDLLRRQCSVYKNIAFHNITVSNPEAYEELAEMGIWNEDLAYTDFNSKESKGATWCGAAYYSLCAHELLPADIERVLYLDAGDTLVVGNIDPYYYGDFDDKSLIVTGTKHKVINGKELLMDSDDLTDQELFPLIVNGLFNSGSFVMNLKKMRDDNCRLIDYIRLARMLEDINGRGQAYFGDQGLLSAAFVGDLKYYAYPESTDLWYIPYDFCMWYFDRKHEKPDYSPSIIHYAGTELAFKPWQGKYPTFLECFQKKEKLYDLNQLKAGQAEYFYLWYECAMRATKTLELCL